MTIRVWVASLILAGAAFAQPPVLRQGISVEMAVTSSAVPMAEADQAGSLIVAVTRSGDLYLEVTSVTPAGLTEELRRAGKRNVYVKADARTPYSNVAAVLEALRNAGATNALLLTSQHDTAEGRDALPKGLEISIGGARDSREKFVGLEPAGPMLFGDVVRIIDASRSAGARVLVVTPAK